MSIWTDALYARARSAVGELLAPYGTSDVALFLDDEVPEDAQRMYLVSPPPFADLPFDTKNSIGREFSRDWIGVDDRDASPERLTAMMEQLRNAFHRHCLIVDGYVTLVARCTGPVGAPSDKTVRALSLTTVLTCVQS